jgi:hypothetical protein
MARPHNPARAAALREGATTYTGLPCPAGHTLRHTGNRSCVACQASAQRQRRGTPAPFEVDALLG